MSATTNAPYFKIDGGKFLTETMGYSAMEVGIYARLMAIYWERGCQLPPRANLSRILAVKTKPELAALEIVLESFFPGGTHERLDLNLKEVREFSAKQSDRARKGHAQRKPAEVSQEGSGDGDF